ncbi:MAG: autotransporter outer membrane beta-barrel domain-containing protein [Puniceicoccales bacterium]|nr:autotransporter outer membrane beta-barrel domain-containing protein [Puniceicoccales bacterium]
MASSRLIHGKLRDYLGDVKENGNDPFAVLLFSHLRRDGENCLHHRGNLVGVLLGGDSVRHLDERTFLRLGGCLGYVNGHVRFSGLPEPQRKVATQRLGEGSVFASYEHFNGRLLKTNALAKVSLGYGRNVQHRTDEDRFDYRARFGGVHLIIAGEGVRNLLRIIGTQIGPWWGCSYAFVHQGSHTERGSGEEIFSQTKVNHAALASLLGINVEREMETGGLRLCGKVGWERQILQRHGSCTASIATTDWINFQPKMPGSSRDALIISGSFRRHLTANWSISATWQGHFASHATSSDAGIKIGYTF